LCAGHLHPRPIRSPVRALPDPATAGCRPVRLLAARAHTTPWSPADAGARGARGTRTAFPPPAGRPARATPSPKDNIARTPRGSSSGALTCMLTSGNSSPSFAMTRQPPRYQTIVEQVLAVARGEDAPTRIADICRAVQVGRRTLLRAFRAICHDTPSHYLHALRLRTARQMLASADSQETSVTEVATQCGFAELGRFAAVYRSTFGEYPSATLRRSSGPRARSRTGSASAGAARTRSGPSHQPSNTKVHS